MKKFKISLPVRSLVLSISVLISFVIFLILNGVSSKLGNDLLSQQMAERWSDENDVSQISCFFTANAGISTDSIAYFRHSLEGALQEASIVQDSPNAGARLWADAYSADGRITISSDRASLSANAIGVGGDFFLFHPLQLLYGAYFSESDLNRDYCIIDEDAAWQLFGSNDVAGMTVMVGGTPHIVSGVVRREQGRLSEAAGLDGTVVYVSYSTLEQYGQHNGISHYEIVMPNPVKGYAYQYVKEHIGVGEDDAEVVENTTRYGILNRLRVLGQFGTRTMSRKPIVYPYWENVARGYEDIIAVITLFAILFMAYPTVILAVWLIICWKRKKWTVRSVLHCLRDRWELKMEELRAVRQRRKAHKDIFDEEEELL